MSFNADKHKFAYFGKEAASRLPVLPRTTISLVFLLLSVSLLYPGIESRSCSARTIDMDSIEKVVSGMVVDSLGKPLSGVTIKLWTRDGDISMTSKTTKDGKFKFIHQPSSTCYLEAQPAKSLRYASAVIEGIAGNENQKIIVNLRKGFLVTGKVVAVDETRGKSSGRASKVALRGVLIKVYDDEHESDNHARAHGGGAALTGRGGDFELVLTPGNKRIAVLNERYSNLSRRYDASFDVIRDMHIEDIVLPPAAESSSSTPGRE